MYLGSFFVTSLHVPLAGSNMLVVPSTTSIQSYRAVPFPTDSLHVDQKTRDRNRKMKAHHRVDRRRQEAKQMWYDFWAIMCSIYRIYSKNKINIYSIRFYVKDRRSLKIRCPVPSHGSHSPRDGPDAPEPLLANTVNTKTRSYRFINFKLGTISQSMILGSTQIQFHIFFVLKQISYEFFKVQSIL